MEDAKSFALFNHGQVTLWYKRTELPPVLYSGYKSSELVSRAVICTETPTETMWISDSSSSDGLDHEIIVL